MLVLAFRLLGTTAATFILHINDNSSLSPTPQLTTGDKFALDVKDTFCVTLNFLDNTVLVTKIGARFLSHWISCLTAIIRHPESWVSLATGVERDGQKVQNAKKQLS